MGGGGRYLSRGKKHRRPCGKSSVTFKNLVQDTLDEFGDLGGFFLDIVFGDVFDVGQLCAADLAGVHREGLDGGVFEFELETADEADKACFGDTICGRVRVVHDPSLLVRSDTCGIQERGTYP